MEFLCSRYGNGIFKSWRERGLDLFILLGADIVAHHCNISHDEIRGFVVCIYGNEWWLGCVLQINGDDVRVNLLQPHGPSPSFSYPHHPDILTVSVEDVLLCASASKSNYNRTSAPKGLSEHSMLCLGNEKQ